MPRLMPLRALLGGCLLLLPAIPALALGLGDYTGHQLLPGGVVIQAGDAALRVRDYGEGVVRLDLLTPGGAEPDSTGMIIRAPMGGAEPLVIETADELLLPGLTPPLAFQKFPLRLRAGLPGGGELREPEEGGWLWNGTERELRLEIDPAWHFGGTGERGIGPDLAGHAFDLRNTQVGGYDGPLETMNINAPVLLCSAGFGLFVENGWPGRLDLGVAEPGLLSWTLPGSELSVFLCTAPDLPGLIEAHTWLSGRPPLPPRWALGYLQSKYGYRNEAAARAAVAGFRQRGLPLDVLILDLYWFSEMGDLSWNHAAWPDPPGMIADFLAQGVHTVLITEPYVTEDAQLYPVLTQNLPQYLARNGSGQPWILPGWWSCGCDAVLVDFTNPAAGAWWWERHLPLFNMGVAGLWTDLGEPERHPAGMVHAGGSADQVHNLYNLRWTEALAAGFHEARPGERFFSLTRSGTAGSQRHGVFTWSGDVSRSWGGLQAQGPILLNMGLSGFPYHGSDLGGFCCGPANGELYLRWLEAGTLAPVMRAHGVDDLPTEPWGFGPAIEAAAGAMLRLRQARLPLLYSLAREAHESGLPLARPTAFADPDFAQLWQVDDAWLLGDQLLVAPVVQPGATSRMVWLPAGEWIDAATGQRYAGHQPVWLPAPLERLPQLVRAGAILPRQPAMDWAGQRPLDTLYVDLWPRPGATGAFRLYEDDGLSLEYETGAYADTQLGLSWQEAGDSASVAVFGALPSGGWPGMPAERIWRPVFHGLPAAPAAVLVDGEAAPRAWSLAELEGLTTGWWHEATAARLHVQAAGAFGAAREVRLEGLPSETALGAAGPLAWRLRAPWPNPANGLVRVAFELRAAETVELDLFDLGGARVARLAAGRLPAGAHLASVDAGALASGLYLLRLAGPDWRETRKLTVLR